MSSMCPSCKQQHDLWYPLARGGVTLDLSGSPLIELIDSQFHCVTISDYFFCRLAELPWWQSVALRWKRSATLSTSSRTATIRASSQPLSSLLELWCSSSRSSDAAEPFASLVSTTWRQKVSKLKIPFSECLLNLYSLCLLAVIVLQIILAVFVLVYNHDIQVAAFKGWDRLWAGRDVSELNRRAIDQVQRTIECCGSNSFLDWLNQAPASCCPSDSGSCTTFTMYKTGCKQQIKTVIQNSASWIAYLSIAMAIVEVRRKFFVCKDALVTFVCLLARRSRLRLLSELKHSQQLQVVILIQFISIRHRFVRWLVNYFPDRSLRRIFFTFKIFVTNRNASLSPLPDTNKTHQNWSRWFKNLTFSSAPNQESNSNPQPIPQN